MFAGGLKPAVNGKSILQFHKRSDPPLAPAVDRLGILAAKWRQPRLALPSARQGFVLQLIDRALVVRDQPGLQRAKPIVMKPRKRERAQRITRQLRQRVMRNRFTAVEEKWDSIVGQRPAHLVVVTFHAAQQNRRVAKPSASARKSQDFSRCQNRFRLRIRTQRQTNCGAGIPGERRRLAPMPLQVRQNGILGKAGRVVFWQCHSLDLRLWQRLQSGSAVRRGFVHARPDRKP